MTESLKKFAVSHPVAAAGCCLLLLVLQNIGIFWQHYVGAVSFLSDFTRIYYPITAFWINQVQQGSFPEWVPFQNMGFPFVLSLQSGVFYPPLWLFAFFKIPYTLHSAAIVQILHVLWGAVGCWMYMRLLGRSLGASLFAAIAFQFFGGFYSNAEHVDIVRAFAYIPWMFWVVHVTSGQIFLAGRNWLTPLIIMLFVTSAYQGNLISHLFMLGIFWMFSWMEQYLQQKHHWRSIAKLHVQIAGLILLGVALSSVYLLPAFALKSYLVREGIWIGKTMDWPPSFWNSLIMPTDAEGTYVYPAMVSAFVTVPVFCLLFLINRTSIKQHGLWIGLTVLAFIMAGGAHLPVQRWVVDVFPPLGYSRFPSSDYRGILCFGLILLASGILDNYLNDIAPQKLTRRFMLCLGLLLFFYLGIQCVNWLSSAEATNFISFVKQFKWLTAAIMIMLFLTQNTISAANTEWLVAIGFVVVVFSALIIGAGSHSRHNRISMLTVLITLELVSGIYFVRQSSDLWSVDVASYELHQAIDHEVLSSSSDMPGSRPACFDASPWESSWQGYLLGNYMCQTQDSKTLPRETVNANAAMDNYMRQPWRARLLTTEQLATCQPENILLEDSIPAPIKMISYGMQEVRYQVKASADFCYVENELLFSGWTGVINKSPPQIKPQEYCGALRSWCLPKGDYEFTARYRSPGLREGAIASLFILLLYIALCVRWFVQKENKRQDKK